MELYEIIKVTLTRVGGHMVQTKPSVITAVMDKDLAYKMLDIYRANEDGGDTYQIRTVRMPEVKEW